MVAINLLGYFPGINMLYSEQMFFQMTSLLSVLYCMINPIPVFSGMKQIKPFVYLSIISLINCVMHNFNVGVLNSTINCCLGVILVWVGYTHISRTKYIKITLCFIALLFFAHILISNYTGINFLKEFSPELGSLIGSSPRYSNFVGIILPVSFQLSPLLAIFLTLSSMFVGEFTPCIVLGILFILHYKMFRVLICLIMVIFSINNFTYILEHFSNRVQTWMSVIIVYLQHPIKGVGFGLYFAGKQALPLGCDNMIFSSILKAFTGLGIMFIGWAVYAQKRFKIEFKPCDAIPLSIILMSTVEYPFEIGKLWYVIAILLSIWLIERGEERWKIQSQ